MNRAKRLAARAFGATCRRLARVVPPDLLYFMLAPYSIARGLPAALRVREYPSAVLPRQPTKSRPGFLARWRYQTSFHQRWLGLVWHDLWQASPWSGRITSNGSETLTTIAKDQSLVIVTLHSGGMVLLTTWLQSIGFSVGSVVLDPNHVNSDLLPPPNDEAKANSSMFRAGDTLQMVRFLAPNRCLMLTADHPMGRHCDVDWGKDGVLHLSISPFRIARMAGAAVVPVLVTDNGRWRYRVHIGSAVPQRMLDEEGFMDAASYVANMLMPIMRDRPFEAMAPLVVATRTRTEESAEDQASEPAASMTGS